MANLPIRERLPSHECARSRRAASYGRLVEGIGVPTGYSLNVYGVQRLQSRRSRPDDGLHLARVVSISARAAGNPPPAGCRFSPAADNPPGPLAASRSSPHSSPLEHAYVQPAQSAHRPTSSLSTPTCSTYEPEILGEPFVNPPKDIKIFGEATGALLNEHGVDIRYHAVLWILYAEVRPKDWGKCVLRLNLTRENEAIGTAYGKELADGIVRAMMRDAVANGP